MLSTQVYAKAPNIDGALPGKGGCGSKEYDKLHILALQLNKSPFARYYKLVRSVIIWLRRSCPVTTNTSLQAEQREYSLPKTASGISVPLIRRQNNRT